MGLLVYFLFKNRAEHFDYYYFVSCVGLLLGLTFYLKFLGIYINILVNDNLFGEYDFCSKWRFFPGILDIIVEKEIQKLKPSLINKVY